MTSCVTFFGTIDAIYSFFSTSTHRWEVLIKHTNIAVRRQSTTRWIAHYNAVKPLKENFEKFIEAIEALCSTDENLDTRGTAQSLLPAICHYTFLCFLYFWHDILDEVNNTQIYLQTKGLSIDKIIIKIEALSIFLTEERQNFVDKALNKALLVSKQHDLPVERRIRLRKKMAGEFVSDTKLTIEEEELCMNVLIV